MKTSAGFPLDALELLLTMRCNLDCSYCKRYAPEEEMPESTARAALDLLFAKGRGPKELSFSGGECLLRFARVRALADRARRSARRRGIAFSMVVMTNGTIISREILDFLAAEDVKTVVTLNGEPGGHDAMRRTAAGAGSWRLVERSLGKLVERLPPRRLIATMAVHPSAAGRLHENFRFLVGRGLRHFRICSIYGAPWTEAEISVLAREYGAVLTDAVASARGNEPLVVEALGSLFRRYTGSSRRYEFSDTSTDCPLSFRLSAWPDGTLALNSFRFSGDAGTARVGDLRKGFDASYRGCSPGGASCADCHRRIMGLERSFGEAYMKASGSEPAGFFRSWQAQLMLCDGPAHHTLAQRLWKLSRHNPALKRYVEVSDAWCDLLV